MFGRLLARMLVALHTSSLPGGSSVNLSLVSSPRSPLRLFHWTFFCPHAHDAAPGWGQHGPPSCGSLSTITALAVLQMSSIWWYIAPSGNANNLRFKILS
jgi:hypothetical protein